MLKLLEETLRRPWVRQLFIKYNTKSTNDKRRLINWMLSKLKTFVLQRTPSRKWRGGFPRGTVVESLPANAGDTGLSPGLGGSHMPQSNWAREPQLLNLRVRSPCSATREATIMRGPRTAMKSCPYLPQLEKALAQKRRPNTTINK